MTKSPYRGCFVSKISSVCHGNVIDGKASISARLASHLSQADPDGIHDVGTLSSEVWMRLVLNDKYNVRRDGVGRLVSFPWERDLGPFLPPSFNLDGENLVFCAHGPTIRIQPLARDLHPLGAAVEDLLQGDPELVDDGRVLLAPLLLMLPALARVHVPGESVEVEAAERAEGVVSIHLHVLVVTRVARLAPKEHLEGVGAAEEGGKGGVGVSVEGVCKVVALTVAGWTASSLET